MSRFGLLVLTLLIVVRQLICLAHGWGHEMLEVPLAPWQHTYVFWVILVGPFVALIVLWLLRNTLAVWFALLVVAAGSLFGIYFHFGPVNPDHVTALPDLPGRTLFIVTAVLLVVSEAATVGWGLYTLRNSATKVVAGHA